MSKKKIADSIIIRVGGGIREVPREPVAITDPLESVRREPGFEQSEDVRPPGVEMGVNTKIGSQKRVN